MQTLRTNHGTYTLSPTRNVGELQAKFAKINGKHKPTKIKPEKRWMPEFKAGMSTAQYVHLYYFNNFPGFKHNAACKQADAAGFFAPLNTEPCALYCGEDAHETIECDVIAFPVAELLAA
jgi:hypothetical protein